jgi:hypothetical protein
LLAVNPDQFCELTDATEIPVQWYCPSDQLVLDEARGIRPATPENSEAFVNIPVLMDCVGYLYLKVGSEEGHGGEAQKHLTPETGYRVYVNRHPIDMVVVEHGTQPIDLTRSEGSEETSADCAGWIRSAEAFVLNHQSLLTIRGQAPDWFVASIHVSPLTYSGIWKGTPYEEAKERFAQGDETFLAGILLCNGSRKGCDTASEADDPRHARSTIERAKPYFDRQDAKAWMQQVADHSIDASSASTSGRSDDATAPLEE